MTATPLFTHVPKTGGLSIKVAFGDYIHFDSHRSAFEMLQETTPPWSFAFVRCPWERMVSWYYWRERVRIADGTALSFSKWVLDHWRSLFNRNDGRDSSVRALLTHPDTGDVLVDTVYRFEKYTASLWDISRRLGVEVYEFHENRNALKPTMTREQLLDLYTPAGQSVVRSACAWEIERFDYKFCTRYP